ncbi:MAG: 3,4-dihydroxy-2-butanone-4-phosphate synthase [Pseudomonadota bacterium]
MTLHLDPIELAIQEIAAGRPVVVVDDEDRENEGDLVMAAELATPELVAFMIRHTSGILCTPLESAEAKRLQLTPMVAENDAPLSTAFTVSVDYRHARRPGSPLKSVARRSEASRTATPAQRISCGRVTFFRSSRAMAAF